ncbi:hypothetical protein BV22DRAFT_835279 [Leucogyrophana mollusca]|uniref:Uncharacterized protein n=1 Tax=Leucogyrophana mollusca TaxID=85980 RepID=A0ACB8B2Q0_9AGAM|nr:hypothetical protein BV22DRAFT_835279 [Leucogyrophana mollusca]
MASASKPGENRRVRKNNAVMEIQKWGWSMECKCWDAARVMLMFVGTGWYRCDIIANASHTWPRPGPNRRLADRLAGARLGQRRSTESEVSLDLFSKRIAVSQYEVQTISRGHRQVAIRESHSPARAPVLFGASTQLYTRDCTMDLGITITSTVQSRVAVKFLSCRSSTDLSTRPTRQTHHKLLPPHVHHEPPLPTCIRPQPLAPPRHPELGSWPPGVRCPRPKGARRRYQATSTWPSRLRGMYTGGKLELGSEVGVVMMMIVTMESRGDHMVG